MMQRLLVVSLAGAMLALTPAAHASPPDQTWIAGLYDNADYDDAVLAIVAGLASLEEGSSQDPRGADVIIGLVCVVDESRHAAPSRSSNHTRAPPA